MDDIVDIADNIEQNSDRSVRGIGSSVVRTWIIIFLRMIEMPEMPENNDSRVPCSGTPVLRAAAQAASHKRGILLGYLVDHEKQFDFFSDMCYPQRIITERRT